MGCAASLSRDKEAQIAQLKAAQQSLKDAEKYKKQLEGDVQKLQAKVRAAEKAGAQKPGSPTAKDLEDKRLGLQRASNTCAFKALDVGLLEAALRTTKAADAEAVLHSRLKPHQGGAVNGPHDVRETVLEHAYEVAKAEHAFCRAEVESWEAKRNVHEVQAAKNSADAEVSSIQERLETAAAADKLALTSSLKAVRPRQLATEAKSQELTLQAKVAAARVVRFQADVNVKKAEAALIVPESKLLPGKQPTSALKALRKELESKQAEQQAAATEAASAEAELNAFQCKDDTSDHMKRVLSASKIQALARGVRARSAYGENVAEIAYAAEPKLNPQSYGFICAHDYGGLADVSDEVRYAVRDKTALRVLWQLGHDELSHSGIKVLSNRPPKFEDGFKTLLRNWDALPRQLPAGVLSQLRNVRLFTSPLSSKAGYNSVDRGNFQGGRNARGDEGQGDQCWGGSSPSRSSSKPKYLLGKFDCLAVPAIADYNSSFERIRPGKGSMDAVDDWTEPGQQADAGWFYVLHAAGINIGEFAQAEDFKDYADVLADADADNNLSPKTTPMGKLQEARYLADMGCIWTNILRSILELGCEDAVLFPFGMGAFLRNLRRNDVSYQDEQKMYSLRFALAMRAMDSIAEALLATGRSLKACLKRIHFCLVNITAESLVNHNAFVKAAEAKSKDFPELKKVLTFCQNADALQVAAELAAKSSKTLSVALLNGANRKLIGNHWFKHGARRAIDENLHRRCSTMGRVSLLLNKGTWPITRLPTTLAEHVRAFHGKVKSLPAPDVKEAQKPARASVPPGKSAVVSPLRATKRASMPTSPGAASAQEVALRGAKPAKAAAAASAPPEGQSQDSAAMPRTPECASMLQRCTCTGSCVCFKPKKKARDRSVEPKVALKSDRASAVAEGTPV